MVSPVPGHQAVWIGSRQTKDLKEATVRIIVRHRCMDVYGKL